MNARAPWGMKMGGWKNVVALLAGALSLLLTAHAGAKDAATAKVPIGFSNLVARLDDDQIGFARPEYRVFALEALRKAGYNAVGAENLVFGKDDAEKADLVLGGTVKELQCRTLRGWLRCSVGIEWQLLDRESDRVVYQVLTRHAEYRLPSDNDAAAGKALTLGALRALMKRATFQRLAERERAVLPKDDDFAAATFKPCSAEPHDMPADFEKVADGTVVIKSGGGVGSGFFLGPDGLVLTAAHVVSSGKVELKTRDGKTLKATVVRLSHRSDVALLTVGKSVAPRSCLELEPAPRSPGQDIYAIGSPAGEQLAFSLSRGIVSGLRTIADVPLLQTDASLSPGNSGGALVEQKGRIVGVVSRKIAGHAVEGLGFAIPIEAGLLALRLTAAPETTPSLLEPRAEREAEALPTKTVVDQPDALISLDPEGDRKRAEARDLQERTLRQRKNTPWVVPWLRWGGVALASAGSIVALKAYSDREEYMKRSDYEDARLRNDLGWAAAIVGSSALVTSFFLVPALERPNQKSSRSVTLAAGPSNMQVKVSF
ncbi:MAG: serine protease [Myxococcales bacterium]|nr:MAG: serine protease [Myxococcales bacterium]